MHGKWIGKLLFISLFLIFSIIESAFAEASDLHSKSFSYIYKGKNLTQKFLYGSGLSSEARVENIRIVPTGRIEIIDYSLEQNYSEFGLRKLVVRFNIPDKLEFYETTGFEVKYLDEDTDRLLSEASFQVVPKANSDFRNNADVLFVIKKMDVESFFQIENTIKDIDLKYEILDINVGPDAQIESIIRDFKGEMIVLIDDFQENKKLQELLQSKLQVVNGIVALESQMKFTPFYYKNKIGIEESSFLNFHPTIQRAYLRNKLIDFVSFNKKIELMRKYYLGGKFSKFNVARDFIFSDIKTEMFHTAGKEDFYKSKNTYAHGLFNHYRSFAKYKDILYKAKLFGLAFEVLDLEYEKEGRDWGGLKEKLTQFLFDGVQYSLARNSCNNIEGGYHGEDESFFYVDKYTLRNKVELLFKNNSNLKIYSTYSPTTRDNWDLTYEYKGKDYKGRFIQYCEEDILKATVYYGHSDETINYIKVNMQKSPQSE